MNWQNVNAFLQTWSEQRGLPADMNGMSLVLVDFQNEADCDYFYPGRDMVSHKAFTMALAKLARERGARTEHATVHREHYRAWLAAEQVVDTAENRDAFIESRYKVLPAR
jgi:glycine/D-amino acid oxidase-like deaminating enzyme